jgi:hypothetical protein
VKVQEIRDEGGRVFAFEIPRPFGGRRRVRGVIGSIPGVRVTRLPRQPAGSPDEIFCGFELGGVGFHAWEPFGDRSRCWIGADDTTWHPEIETIADVFRAARNPARTLRLVSIASAGYVLLNVGLIATIPIVHPLVIRVAVRDAQARPVAGAIVGMEPWWELMSAAGRAAFDPEHDLRSRSDRDGRAEVRLVYPQQPLWVFPTIGRADFSGHALRVDAPGQRPVVVQLAEALGADVALATESVELEVRVGAPPP